RLDALARHAEVGVAVGVQVELTAAEVLDRGEVVDNVAGATSVAVRVTGHRSAPHQGTVRAAPGGECAQERGLPEHTPPHDATPARRAPCAGAGGGVLKYRGSGTLPRPAAPAPPLRCNRLAAANTPECASRTDSNHRTRYQGPDGCSSTVNGTRGGAGNV